MPPPPRAGGYPVTNIPQLTDHRRFTLATNIDVYFCDPQSPWQCGSNENTNGLLRQYFPKGTDLSVYSQAHLNKVARQLNERPRETLQFETPAESLTPVLRRPVEPAGEDRKSSRAAKPTRSELGTGLRPAMAMLLNWSKVTICSYGRYLACFDPRWPVLKSAVA